MPERRWGKAGVRLTDAEARQARQSRGRAKLQSQVAEQVRAIDDQRARQKWEMGLVVPAHITFALNAHSLYGPEVDHACGVEEPAVDHWEAGTLYPSWEQVVALARLTQRTPMYFMAPVHPITSVYDTSMRFHVKPGEQFPLPVHRFTTKALYAARTIGVHA